MNLTQFFLALLFLVAVFLFVGLVMFDFLRRGTVSEILEFCCKDKVCKVEFARERMTFVCHGCELIRGDNWYTLLPKDALNHLWRHQWAGHHVPARAIDRVFELTEQETT